MKSSAVVGILVPFDNIPPFRNSTSFKIHRCKTCIDFYKDCKGYLAM